jgi:UDP-2-acetamido-3-amino-2,3-dideoxy-glucuronate N-acetyltransferase
MTGSSVTQIHETAVIEPGATIGRATQVWHHVHVRSGAIIGAECSIGKDVFIDSGVIVGDRVRIQNHVSLYAGVDLADDVFVGPSAVFTNDRYPRANSPDWEIFPTRAEQGTSIGANATIVCGITLGRWSAIAAGAVVTRDILPFELVAGNPARRLGWVCKCGHVLDRAGAPEPPLKPCPKCGETIPSDRGSA